MARLQTINHKGKSIILVDLSNGTTEEIENTLLEASNLITHHPLQSIRILTDVANTPYNQRVSEAIKNFSSRNTPYVYRSAVTGLEGIRSVLLQTVTMITRREIKTFPDRGAALDYLTLN